MRQLPERPDLDQLRRQARNLHRGGLAGDPDSVRRLWVVSPRTNLTAAQLALAREYGFPSWARLKAEVERRCASLQPAATDYRIRAVESLEELATVFDVVGAQMEPTMTHEDRRFQDLARRFGEDRELMLMVEEHGRIVGGALMFRTTLRAIGLEPAARGKGLGRRLLERLEEDAARKGRGGIRLGVGRAPSPARDFYEHMGYSGRSRMGKELPLSPALRYRESSEWRRRLEDLRQRRDSRGGGLNAPGRRMRGRDA